MVELSVVRDLVAIFGVIAGFSYYVVTVRNQEKSRQSQIFMNIYNQSFANPQFMNALKKVGTTTFNNYDEWLKAYDWFNPNPVNPELSEAIDYVNSFYEGLGVFVKEGLIDIKLVALTMTGATKLVWEKQAPFIKQVREQWGNPIYASEQEYLYNQVIKYNEEHPKIHG